MPSIALPRHRLPYRPGADPFSGRSWACLTFVTDAAMLWIAIAIALRIEPRGPLPENGWLLGLGLAVGTIGHFAARGTYAKRSSRRSTLDVLRETLSAHASGVALALAGAALLSPGRAVTSALIVAAGFGALLVTIGRGVLMLLRHRARVDGRSVQKTLIVGAGEVGADLERRLLECPGLGLRPIGFLDDDPAPAFHAASPKGEVLGTPRELAKIVRRTDARNVIVAFSHSRDAEILPLVRTAQALGLEVSVVPRMFEDVSAHQQIEHVGGLALVGMPTPNPRAWPYAIKHGFGRLVAIVLTLLAGPLLLGLALGVRLSSPGPVLFRQRRVGRDGQVFEILKFRTMKLAPPPAPGAEKRLATVGAGPGGVEGDDRRTAIGTFLRRSSLDELPQLLNVVRGHMSLVGPRPERPEFVALFGQEVRGYSDRHRVKSGMTGWAQVNGLRGATSIADRIELDNWYVANWSLWLDIKILLLTPIEVVRSRAEATTGAPAPEPPAEEQPLEEPRRLHEVS